MGLSIRYGGYNLAFKIYNSKNSQSIFLIAKPISYVPPTCTVCAGHLATHCSPSTLSPAFILRPDIAFVWVVLVYTFISIIYNQGDKHICLLSTASLLWPCQPRQIWQKSLITPGMLAFKSGGVGVRWGSYSLSNNTINFLKGRYP